MSKRCSVMVGSSIALTVVLSCGFVGAAESDVIGCAMTFLPAKVPREAYCGLAACQFIVVSNLCRSRCATGFVVSARNLAAALGDQARGALVAGVDPDPAQ